MEQKKITSLKELTSNSVIDDAFIKDQRNDEISVQNIVINTSSFIRIGIKNAKFFGGKITHSLFEDVYARNAIFDDIDFTGTTFRNCNFDKAKFSNCNFRYCKFSGCYLPIEEIKSSLPNEQNLKKELATNLKTNFTLIGKKKEADIFLDIEIEAEKKELMCRFLSKTGYYKNKYDSIDRIEALFKLLAMNISAFIWGYGHKVNKLFYSYIFIMILFSFITFILQEEYLVVHQHQIRSLSILECIQLVFEASINYSDVMYQPVYKTGRFLTFSISYIGILYLGLLSATLYRRISR